MGHSHEFVDLIDPRRAVAVEAVAIPSPGDGDTARRHLFVNCRYLGLIDSADAGDLLERARIDVASIVTRAIERRVLNSFFSICVSILGQLRSGARRTIYRYAVHSNALPTESAFDEHNLIELEGCKQSSEIDEIESLPQEPVA